MTSEIIQPSLPTDTASEAPEASDTRAAELERDLERIARGVVRIGALWARHGLEIGRGALRTSAATMETTAEMLGALADGIGRVDRRAEKRPEAGR